MTHRRACVATLVAVALAVAACDRPSGERAGAVDERRLLVAGEVPARTVAAAAAAVQRRLVRLGAPEGTAATADGAAVRLSEPVDRVLSEAAGRRAATELRAVAATTIGPCSAGAGGAPSLPAGRRCYALGERLAGVDAIAAAQAQLQPGIGWGVLVSVQPGAPYTALRTALAGAGGRPVAVVADGTVVAAIDASAVLGLRVRIGPGMTEREARRLAAALLVNDELPVALSAPSPDATPEPGPRADADSWLAALSANVCGTWLPDAPATPDASGIHSHGDGLVYAHPSSADEAGANATIGLWLAHGSWKATASTLTLWDGTTHRAGNSCPDGRPGTVRWWVDGVERSGDPAAHRVGNGEAITLSFNPDGVTPGPPPAAERLPLPRLTPEA